MKPLAQVCPRLHERYLTKKKVNIPPLNQILENKQIHNHACTAKIEFKNSILACKSPNNIVVLKK